MQTENMKKITILFTLLILTIVSCENKKSNSTKPTLYEIKVGGRYGLIDSTGKMIVNPQFDNIYIPYDDKNFELIAVRLGNKIGFIDRNGQFKINPQFEIDTLGMDAIIGTEFSEGLAVVRQNKLFGFIDTTGKMVIKAQYEDLHSFKEGLASFQQNKKWGFIDKKGKIVIKPQFDQAYYFENGLAEIRKFNQGDIDYPSLAGYVNKNGEIIWQPSN
jgi:hypothetical protein